MSCQRCHSLVCRCPPPIIVKNTELIDQQAQRIVELEQQCYELIMALHRISLGSQDSGTTKEGLGREARATLAKVKK